MPTAAKLFAAAAFILVALVAAEAFKPGLPPETAWGIFTPICGGIGGLSGWLVMGRLAGKGYRNAIGSGVRTSATIVFFALLIFSVYQMIIKSMRKLYKGVFEAIEGVFDIALVNALALMRAEPLIVLFVGGMIGGVLAEWASRRWP